MPSQEILKIRDGTPLEMPSQEILKIRDGTPLEAEEILIYIKKPSNKSVWHFSSKLDILSNVVQKKRVARILFFKIRPSQEILKIRDVINLDIPTNVVQRKRVAQILFSKIRPSQEILKIRDGTPMEAEEILIYIKSPQNKSIWHFSSNLDVPSNVVQKKRVARIMFFKIRPSQEILKIRDGTPMEAEEILIYIKKPSKKSVWHFSSNLDVPSNVVQKKRVAQILFFKIRPSQEILKIRDVTLMEAKEILIYIKKPSKQIDIPTNVVQRKRVAQILFSKIRPSQEILKIRDGTPMEAEEILIYIKSPQNKSVWHFSSNLDVPSNVVQKKRVARIMFFKIRPSQEILKIRDGTPMEAEEILIYIKKPSKKSVWHFSSNLDVPSMYEPSQEILKIRDGTPLEMPSQEILKIRDGTPLEAEEILIYIKNPSNKSVWHFSSKLDILSNVVQKKRVARILFFKIRPSQEILKIRDVQKKRVARILFIKIRPSQEILKIRDDIPTNVVQRKRVAQILFSKIRPSQEILKIRDGTPMEAEEILIYIKSPQNKSIWHFSSNLDVPSNVVQKKRVARIMFFKTRPSQEILKIRDGTPMEAEEILIYIKKPSKKSVWHFSSNLDVPSNVVQKKRVAQILFFKIRPSQEILKIRDVTLMEAKEILIYIKKPSKQIDIPTNVVQRKRVAQILFSKIRPSQEILNIRDGTPMEAEEILIYIKSPQNKSVWHFSSNLDVPSNVVQKKRVARIMFFKIRPSQEILKIRDGTPMEAEEILIYIKSPQRNRKRVARILFFKIRPSQEILKIRDGTPLETEEILTYIKSPQNRSFWHFYSNLDVPSNIVHKKRVARNLFIKIRPSQEILNIRDGTSLETEEILTYIKKPSKQIVARILFFKIRPSQEILKIRDGTPLEAEEILIYMIKPSNKSVWHFSSNLDVPINVVQKNRVARILFFKIRPSQEILKIRDGTPLETEEILIYIKSPQINRFDVPSNVVQKKRVARILFFKIRPSQEILKIRHGTPLETEEILTYIKSPQNRSFWHFYSNLDVPSNVVHKKRVARILFIKIRPSQEILKIRDGTPMEAEEILIYIKSPQNKSVWHFSSNLDVPSNVVQKKRVARIMFFKIRPSQEILKIRDGTPMEAEEILIYIKKPS
ncbi:hypothetical protein OROMI_001632 [Orobanche minor]